jgi:uncharacterized protein YigE (DUF2233 family)
VTAGILSMQNLKKEAIFLFCKISKHNQNFFYFAKFAKKPQNMNQKHFLNQPKNSRITAKKNTKNRSQTIISIAKHACQKNPISREQ